MAKEIEEVCSENSTSKDQNDTLEAEISRLEATLHELDENDLSGFCKSVDNLEDELNGSDPYEDVNEKTITNNISDSDSSEDSEKTIIITNFVDPTHTETAESFNHCKKSKWSGTETWDPHKSPENEPKVCEEVFCSDHSKATNMEELHTFSSRISNKTEENKGIENSSGSIVSSERWKISESINTSSEFLSIHPTIDNDMEALIKSPIMSSVQIIDTSFEVSTPRTFQNIWLMSPPKITNREEYKQSKFTFPSLHSVIQNKLASFASLPSDNDTEREEQDLKACHLGISELQSSPQKLFSQKLVKNSTECKVESQSNQESSDSVIILEEFNLKKISNGSFLDLDISQDYEKEWFATDKDGKCGSVAGPISSTPNTNRFSSGLKRKFLDIHNGESFVILDETGEVPLADSETEVAECLSAEKDGAKNLNNSIKEVNCEPKSAELGGHQELNISVKHAPIVEHTLKKLSDESDKLTPEVPHVDDKGDEGYVKTITVIKSDYLFHSDDPEENADNFNPEWEVLRNLKTDEERYKAMRNRWRSLVIPDPNKNLTCHSWRVRNKSKKRQAKVSKKMELKLRKPLRHKRTHSDPCSSSQWKGAKRSRTQSCAVLFDARVQELKQRIDNEQYQLLSEEAQALQDLHNAQAMDRIRLQSNFGGDQFGQLHNLHQDHLESEALLRKKYNSAHYQVEFSQEKKIRILERASTEVQSLHKYYHGLETMEDNDTSAHLSETQLGELWETEDFYEKSEQLYT